MKLLFDPNALEDLKYWVKYNKKIALEILSFLDEIQKTPFKGTGKPEALRYNLSGCWSRRIDLEHRIVYKVEDNIITVLVCRYHY